MTSTRTAIVTGAGARDDGIGNGRAAAILLARRGINVICVDRDLNLAARTVEMIRDEGLEASAIEADVTLPGDCEKVAAFAVSTYGGIDYLDNNVGIGSNLTVVDEDPARWAKVMDVNVSSMFLMAKYAIPEMAKRGGGAIVNISSISAFRPRGLTAYTTSKGAVIALTKAMAVDHAADGIRVNCIAPGPVLTPMVQHPKFTEKDRQRRIAASPLGVEGTGWDIGEAVAFLLSDQARYITGQTLVVDGGVSLASPAR